jgi:hypothetical protein
MLGVIITLGGGLLKDKIMIERAGRAIGLVTMDETEGGSSGGRSGSGEMVE